MTFQVSLLPVLRTLVLVIEEMVCSKTQRSGRFGRAQCMRVRFFYVSITSAFKCELDCRRGFSTLVSSCLSKMKRCAWQTDV